MTQNLMAASTQWAARPADERFTSLTALAAACQTMREQSRQTALSSRAIMAAPVEDNPRALVVIGPDGAPAMPTHWAFGQLAQHADAPASYLRNLPSDLAADCVNYGLRRREVKDLGILLRRDESETPGLHAVTGANYGRIWNADIGNALVKQFGDGLNGDFRVPGEFGQAVEVTKENTTLYASDRDMFVFLADENHKVEIPNRRNGEPGLLSRGFFVWNSEVGSKTFGIATFLFDYVCCNRIVWGAEGYQEIRIRHTSGAPDRWIEEVAPALVSYSQTSTSTITDAVKAARSKRIDDVETFLTARFTKNQAKAIQLAHQHEEGRPIETLWDATTGATAYARGIEYQDERVVIERVAGKIMALAS